MNAPPVNGYQLSGRCDEQTSHLGRQFYQRAG